MTGPALCPRCGSSERVEVIAPPAHDPDARFFCPVDNLAFRGSQAEAQAEQRARADKDRERAEAQRRREAAEAAHYGRPEEDR